MTMDCTSDNFYQIQGIDFRDLSDSFFSDKEDIVFGEDSLKFPAENLYYQFNSGRVLIGSSLVTQIHHLYSASNFFQEIVVLQFNEEGTTEPSRRQHDPTGAVTDQILFASEGNRENQEQEMHPKLCIKQIVTCDFKEDNITAPTVLPLSDCIINAWTLNVISNNEDECTRNLEKILNLLKPGGHLILSELLNATYMAVKEERVHVFKCDEAFVKNSLSKLGLVIDYCAVQKRRNASDNSDYSDVMFIVARKEV